MSEWEEVWAIFAAGTPSAPVHPSPRLLADCIRSNGVPENLRDYVAAWIERKGPPPRTPPRPRRGRPKRAFTGKLGDVISTTDDDGNVMLAPGERTRCMPSEDTTLTHWTLVHNLACRVSVLHAAYKARGVPRGQKAKELAIADAAKAYSKLPEYVRKLLKEVKTLPKDWQDSIPKWRELVTRHRKGDLKLFEVLSPPRDERS